MFGNKNEKKGQPTSKTFNQFGEGTSIVGEIRSGSDIRLDGAVNGTIYSKSKVVLGVTGIVEGDIYCENADISGKVSGKVEIKGLLFLKSTAVVNGDIIASKIVVEAGARFNGTCSMNVKELKHGEQISATLKKEAV
ncbi:MAG TPA: polymer-forming cytoskeletal protein [Flavobacterium sp.]|nr:polymer-forming cytoskeletal protein [Flavobacterium sp.]